MIVLGRHHPLAHGAIIIVARAGSGPALRLKLKAVGLASRWSAALPDLQRQPCLAI